MRKFKLFLDFDKEEKWLNSMAKKGYELEDKFLRYKFKSTKPQDTVIKIDCRLFRNKKDFIDYCTLFEDSGWKHISGSKSSGTQYFKKTNQNGNDDIFSDKLSKATRYKRLSKIMISFALTYSVVLVAAADPIVLSAIINPKLLYLTPGLWEKQGVEFWHAFWFETPFAIFRGLLLLLPVAFIILYFILAYRSNRLYRVGTDNEKF